jgi:UDP-N-acetylmuramyl pentapeptide phosphotransferase/UDP-N-acetylglucosamine-1-phosphate transferase
MGASPLPLIAMASAITALTSLVLVRLVIPVARSRGMLDQPGRRQSHSVPTPTGGGLGLVAACVLVSLLLHAAGAVPDAWARAIVPGMILLAVTGWIDDSRSLSQLLRLAVQLVVSFGLLAFLVLAGQVFNPAGLLLGGITLVWVMNMYNFMDGSHGMAGFEGLFVGVVTGVIFLVDAEFALAAAAFLVAAACLGFLPWNFPAPRVFMGDSGSVPLGFALGGLLLLGVLRDALVPAVAAMALSVFLVDSTLTLIRRVIRGERWYTAHRKHVYQRLIAEGWPHSRVLLLYQAINITIVVPAIVLATMYPQHAWPIAGLLALLLAAGWYVASLRLEVRI